MGSTQTLVQINSGCLVVAAVLLLLAGGITFVRARRGQGTQTVPDAAAAPHDLPPAAAGLLVRGDGRRAEADALVAAVIDLAERGHLCIISAPSLTDAGLARPDDAFVLLHSADAGNPADFLRPFETRLLGSLFRPAFEDTVPLRLALSTYRAERRAGDTLPIIADVRTVLIERGLIDIRRRGPGLLALGLLVPAAVVCLGLALYLVVTPDLAANWLGLTVLTAVATLLLFAGAARTALALRPQTAAGQREARKWRTFRATATLPPAYAIAFGTPLPPLTEAPAWLSVGAVETLRRDGLPRPELVSAAAGDVLVRLCGTPTAPDPAQARALISTLIARLTAAMTPPATGGFS